MHSLVKHCHDPNRAIRQQPPVDVVMFMAAVKAVHPKLGWNSAPGCLSRCDLVEPLEYAADVSSGLFLTLSLTRINVDLVETIARPSLDADFGHTSLPCVAGNNRLGVEHLIGGFRRGKGSSKLGF